MDSEPEIKLMSLLFQLYDLGDILKYLDGDSDDANRMYISLLIKVISLVNSIDLDSQPESESEFMSLIYQTISCCKSMDLDSQPKQLQEFIQLISDKISLTNSMDSYMDAKSNLRHLELIREIFDLAPEPEIISLIDQIVSLVSELELDLDAEEELDTEPQTELELELESKFISLLKEHRYLKDAMKGSHWGSNSDSASKYMSCVIQIISLCCSIDQYSKPKQKPKSKVMSFIFQIISFFKTLDLDSQPKPIREFIQHISPKISPLNAIDSDTDLKQFFSLYRQMKTLKPKPSLLHLIKRLSFRLKSELDSEPELISIKSLISQLMSINDDRKEESPPIEDVCREPEWEYTPLVTQLLYHFNTMDLDLVTKWNWESELIPLIKQTISLFNSMDLDSQPSFISLISQKLYFSSMNSDRSAKLGPESELTSLIQQIFSLTISKDPKWSEFIPLCPQVQVRLEEGKFHVIEEISRSTNNKWNCLPLNWEKFRLVGDDTHFLCRGCNGKNHDGFNKVPVAVEIKHDLHPKHSLQLVLFQKCEITTRECYCCDKELEELFYYCSACDYAMNIVCVKKRPVLSIHDSKWHQDHPLALFPRLTSLTCNLCALSHSSCPFYMCPPCNLVIHQSCLTLPRVIRISRHPHRISFTSSFDQGDWSCGVCRRNIDNNFGGFACNKDGCSYAAHSKCATQSNVWDGVELENMPEEIEEEVIEPFVRISDGSIQHFRHQQHYLRLDMNTGRDYDENKQCQACFTPIYFGNFYSCIQCDYILHEKCAELSRKIYHPIHPHLLTLVGGYNSDMITKRCSACYGLCTAEFFYSCGENGCDFQLHVPCATISEPLIHESHTHPLFLTSKPGERRMCWACKNAESCATKETFNCIEECDFALCFVCATLPQKVMYKHDKHILTLCFGKETNTLTYWCEVCEEKIMSKERFYMCDEYCCVSIHIKCMLGEDLYMKPGSLWNHYNRKVSVLTNNHMSRPTCSNCKKRCPHKTVLEEHGLIFCGQHCCRLSLQ